MPIMVTQWLCPSRHASIAVAWESDQTTEKDIIEAGEEGFGPGKLNRKCGICFSEDLKPESEKSRFQNLEECIQAMRASQLNQIASRIYLEALRNQSRN